MDPARAEALLATLGQPRAVKAGDSLPPFFHQIYFWTALPPEDLGRDGHPRVGLGLIPDLALPRRMWAGGELIFHAPLRAGITAERHSECREVTQKNGRSGPLAFVTLDHKVFQDGVLCIEEVQELVYREDPSPNDTPRAPVKAALTPVAEREVQFNSTLLFRYSALTFNGHRIHYDQPYAREVEGYDGLVVHGPLLAQLMMLWAEEREGPLTSFRFRGVAPLTDGDTARLACDGNDYWVLDRQGGVIMQAEANG